MAQRIKDTMLERARLVLAKELQPGDYVRVRYWHKTGQCKFLRVVDARHGSLLEGQPAIGVLYEDGNNHLYAFNSLHVVVRAQDASTKRESAEQSPAHQDSAGELSHITISAASREKLLALCADAGVNVSVYFPYLRNAQGEAVQGLGHQFWLLEGESERLVPAISYAPPQGEE